MLSGRDILKLNIITFSIYFAIAHLSLAVSSDHVGVVAFWPAAGFAVGMLLTYGKFLLPGIFLAHTFVNVYFLQHSFPEMEISSIFFISACIGLGGILQAAIASWFLRVYLNGKLLLRSIKSLVTYMIIIGVSHIISPIIGISTLLSNSLIEFHNVISNISTWYIGDLLGCLLFAPLICEFLSKPLRESLSGCNYCPIVLPTVAWLLLTNSHNFFLLIFIFPLIAFAAFRQSSFGFFLTLNAVTIVSQYHLVHKGHNHLVPQENFKLQFFVGILVLMGNVIQTLLHEKDDLYEERERERQLLFHDSKIYKLGEMSAGVAHEVNNSLHIIKGNLKHLKRDSCCIEGENPKKMQKIDSALERISQIVKSLNKYSRKSSETKNESIRVIDLVNDSVDMINYLLVFNGIDLSLDIDNELEITCNPVELSQVLINLINNSIDAIEGSENSWIRIAAKEHNGRIKITVMDSGRGIPEEFVDKIFTPFSTTKERGKGVGLGMYISREIIERHHGSLEYVKNSDRTTFEMILS